MHFFPSGPCTPSITGLKDTFVFFSLAIDPICPTTLHAGTVLGGVFGSINSGASWSSVNFTAASTDIEILATDPIDSGTVYAVAKNDTIRRASPHWPSPGSQQRDLQDHEQWTDMDCR